MQQKANMQFDYLPIKAKYFLQINATRAEVQTSWDTAISINVVGLKHEAKRQDRKFTWDFYE